VAHEGPESLDHPVDPLGTLHVSKEDPCRQFLNTEGINFGLTQRV
jgi:hypothetical protein